MYYKNLTAPCGKDCFNCPLYIGKENRENREVFLKRNSSEFPCAKLQPLADRAERVPHALKIFNLRMIQKMGVEKWATEYSKQIFTDYYTRKLDSCM